MATAARARIEALLRERKLDTTLTTAHPWDPATADEYVVPTGIESLDACLGGGLARGQVSEIVGLRSSGRTSVMMSALAATAARGELVALVDTFDTFDPPSAHAAGLDLSRLLWVRGTCELPRGITRRNAMDEAIAAGLDRALKCFNLILQAGGFGLVVLDVADAPIAALKRLPFTTWFRLQRPIEGTSTACAIVGNAPIARSAGGVTIALHRTADTQHAPWGRLFPGLTVDVTLARARGLAETCRFQTSPIDLRLSVRTSDRTDACPSERRTATWD